MLHPSQILHTVICLLTLVSFHIQAQSTVKISLSYGENVCTVLYKE